MSDRTQLHVHLQTAHGISARRLLGRERRELQWLDDVLHGRIELPPSRATTLAGLNRIPWPKPSYYAKEGDRG